MTPNPTLIEQLKIAFWASLTNANAGMKWLDHDSMEEMIVAAWVGFEEPALATLQGSAALPSEAMRKALGQAWTDFLDANPDDLNSPDDLPDHALVTCEQMIGIVEAAMRATTPTAPDQQEPSLSMCEHGADRGSYCGYCGGYSKGAHAHD